MLQSNWIAIYYAGGFVIQIDFAEKEGQEEALALLEVNLGTTNRSEIDTGFNTRYVLNFSHIEAYSYQVK